MYCSEITRKDSYYISFEKKQTAELKAKLLFFTFNIIFKN